MATISIADNDARIQHSIGSGGNTANSTTYAIDFPFFALDDIDVTITTSVGVDTVLSRGSGAGTFAVSGTSVDDGFSGGSITLGSVYTSVTVTITRDIPIERTSDFATSGPFNISSLNTELDKVYAVMQQIETNNDRSLTMPDSDALNAITLPNQLSRLGKVLGFNASTGAAEALGQLTAASVSASTVSVGGNATASVSVSGNTAAFALGIPTGATGATGSIGATGGHVGLSMTWDTDTSGDSGAGKIYGNNSTIANISVLLIDDVDDNSVNIASYVQSWDDISNAVAKGIIQIVKEGTPSTYAIFKITGSVTDSTGYNQVAVTHVVSNGTFSDGMGVTVTFVPSGADGSGDITGVTAGTNLSGGGDSGAVTINLADATVNAKGAASFATADFTVTSGSVSLQNVVVKTSDINTFTKAQVPSVFSATLDSVSGVLNFDDFQNFIVTLSAGANTFANPTTEDANVGQTGVIIFIQRASGNASSLSFADPTDYETAGSAGIALSADVNDYDVVPYIIKANNSILLGSPQLNFG